MAELLPTASETRMIFLGETTLTDGFRLIGFETFADPTPDELDLILQQLVAEKRNAFIVLDHQLSECDSPMLERVRAEGGRIIITEVPPLNAPDNFHCKIDNQVHMLLGSEKRGDCTDD